MIAAPAGTRLHTLRACLESRGIRVLVPHDLKAGLEWAAQIRDQISKVDLVIGILRFGAQSGPIFFELGQAHGLGRQIVIIASPKSKPLPFPLSQFLVLRADLDNRAAIEFALDQLLSASKRPAKFEPVMARELPEPLGNRADALVARLDVALESKDWRSLDMVVEDALKSSGVEVVVRSPDRDFAADFAVWSDLLEPYVGNPLLVEVKLRVAGSAETVRAAKELRAYCKAAGSRWGLLLYGEGPDSSEIPWYRGPANVLALPLRTLLISLRAKSFPEVIWDLRNRRVHGSSL